MLIPIEEHELLVFWVQLFVIVVLARSLGWLMRKIGLPTVIGELGAGLLLGPSVFKQVWPEGFEWFLHESESQSAALLAVGWVGVALLLVVTGFETDLGLIARLGKPAALVSAGSLIVPMIGGLIVGYLVPTTFLGEDADRLPFALFVALALSVSSLAVVAKILSELGLMRRDFGQITVAVGMANDVVGWLLLGVFTGLAASGEVNLLDVGKTIGGLLIFIAIAMTLGQRVVDAWLRQNRRSESDVTSALTVAIVTMLGFGVVTQWLGVEAVLGAFVAGVVLHRSRFQNEHVLESIEGMTYAFFAPVFFASAGLRVDLSSLQSREALVWTGIIIAVAIVAKFIGAYAGGRSAGISQRGSLALGAGLNARGALEIVIATVGAAVGVFNTTAFTVIVLVPVVTSVFASIGLRMVVRDFAGTPDEVERLEREVALAKNLVVRSSRLLVPSRGRPGSISAASVLHMAWPEEAAATILSLGPGAHDFEVEPLMNVFWNRDVEHRRLRTTEIADAIIAESALGFGVIGMGVDEPDAVQPTVDGGFVISELVDEVLSRAKIPVVLVRRARNLGPRGLPAAFGRALVPVAGTPSSRAATEVAFNISSHLGTEVVLSHIVDRAGDDESVLAGILPRRGSANSGTSAREIGDAILQKSTEMAQELGVEAKTAVRTGHSTAEEVLSMVTEIEADLVVMGANLRRLNNRPFLGHTVEQVLARTDATVVLVLVPFDL